MSDNLFDVKLSDKNGALDLMVRLLYDIVNDATSVVEKGDTQGRIRIDRYLHKSTRRLGVKEGLFYQPIRVGGFWVAGFDAPNRVFVVESSNGEFLHTAGMNTVVLPVAVTAEDEGIFNVLLF